MKRLVCALVLLLGASALTAEPAATGGPVDPSVKAEDLYFSGTDPVLTEQESMALSIADEWQEGNAKSVALSGDKGVIKYKFGVQQPSIVCAVLQVCDVALQQGERINAINLGDTVRWTVEPAIAGEGDNAIQHVVIKPLDVGLETSLIVTTDRRIYHMRLRSHRTRYMPQVAFIYTDGIGLGKRKAPPVGKEGRSGGRQEKVTAAAPLPPVPPAPTEYLSNINFDYRVSGTAGWKPLRVYNDGKRTFIHMPTAALMSVTDAPSLLVVGAGGDSNAAPVSYRVEGDSYVVDNLFDKALLVAGTDRVTIERGR